MNPTESTNVARGSVRIPMIQTCQALESLRDSGHSLSTALAEPVDNSIEARANVIQVWLDQSKNSRGKSHVHRITIADDGTGMDDNTLHHYLQIGFSTRYMRNDTIGKYGVGAKLAALNFGRRIDVWSRDDARKPWQHVYFDLDEAIQEERSGKAPGVEAPDVGPLPEDLKVQVPAGSGTIVIWSKVERLEEGRFAQNFDDLRVEVEKELSRIFRYFIAGGIRLSVNETLLLPHDPLFLMEGSWADKVLTEHLVSDKRGSRDAQVASRHFPARLICDRQIPVPGTGGQKVRLRVTLYPKEVVRKRQMGGDKLATKLRVPENEGCISFVRLEREISYTNVPRIFPRGVENPDRFIGIEVAFSPVLDSFFGVRNVKRGVEPHGELRDALRKELQQHVAAARKELEAIWGQVAQETRETEGEHAPVVDAVKAADLTLPKGRVEEKLPPDEVEQKLRDIARDVVGEEDEKKQEEYVAKIRELPFVLESVSFPGNMFIDVQHINNQVIIRLNTRHRFYREMWEPIKSIAHRDAGSVSGAEAVQTARRTLEALTLLVIAYGKAESMHPTPTHQYSELVMYWGQFLDTLMGKVKDVL